jgi:hypothetical protein
MTPLKQDDGAPDYGRPLVPTLEKPYRLRLFMERAAALSDQFTDD